MGKVDLDLDRPSILNEPRFLPFQNANFDVAQFTSQVLTGSHTTAQAQSEQLRDGARTLELELSTQVISRHRDLLQNSRRLLEAENSLQDVVLSVGSLQSAVRRIKAEIASPYQLIKTKSRQLQNIHAAVDTLRHLIHRLKLAQKLRLQLSGPESQMDLAKAAKIVSDIRSVDTEVDLSDIDAVKADTEFLKTARTTIRDKAHASLLEGMESLSQAKVGSALQVFFNLEELPQEVSNLTAGHVTNVEKRIKTALDSRQFNTTPSSSGNRAVIGQTPTSQEKVWEGLKDVFNAVSSSAISVWHLQRVVSKKRDPLTHVCFLDVLVAPHQPLLTQRFWADVSKALSDAFSAAVKLGKSGPVRDALVGSFPRLVSLVEAMADTVSTETGGGSGIPSAVGPESLSVLMSSLAAPQAAYLAGVEKRCSEAVNTAFPGGTRSLPPTADVQKCIGHMHEELRAAGSSNSLAEMIAGTVSKALVTMCERAQSMAAAPTEVRVIGPSANTAQARNIVVCSALQEVHRSFSGLLPRLPLSASPVLAPALDTVQLMAVNVVAPLFRALAESLEERIMLMHEPSFKGYAETRSQSSSGALSDAPVVDTSAFIVDACATITHFRSEYLSRFVPPPSPTIPCCVTSLVERLAARLLNFFVRHAALHRPLSGQGKLQVAKDMGELAAAVGSALYPLEQLGASSRIMKSFRTLLFMEPSSILGSAVLKELPSTVVLSHLFSRLPDQVLAPHQLSGLTPAQYSLWLDQHNAQEALDHIRSSLQTVSTLTLTEEHLTVLETMRKLCSTGIQI